MSKISVFLILSVFIILCYACQSESEIEQIRYFNNGKDIYIAKCQNCHGEKGEGLAQLAPPLTDTVFLKNNKTKIACFIKYGTEIPMTINGVNYQEKMPAFDEMQSIDIAQLIVYITNSFGNKQGMYTFEQVAGDLKNCR